MILTCFVAYQFMYFLVFLELILIFLLVAFGTQSPYSYRIILCHLWKYFLTNSFPEMLVFSHNLVYLWELNLKVAFFHLNLHTFSGDILLHLAQHEKTSFSIYFAFFFFNASFHQDVDRLYSEVSVHHFDIFYQQNCTSSLHWTLLNSKWFFACSLFDLSIQAFTIGSSFASKLFAPLSVFLAKTCFSELIVNVRIPAESIIGLGKNSKTQLIRVF